MLLAMTQDRSGTCESSGRGDSNEEKSHDFFYTLVSNVIVNSVSFEPKAPEGSSTDPSGRCVQVIYSTVEKGDSAAARLPLVS